MLKAWVAPLICGLLLVSLAPTSRAVRSDDNDKLIGWQGETYKPEDPEASNSTLGSKRPWIQVLSWKPRAFVYHNFLSDAEAAHIIKLAAPQMKRSTVVGDGNQGVVDDIRTSAGTFLMRNQDKIITAIEHRMALFSGLPPDHQEDIQVLRYGPTNKYGAHVDGLGRVATALVYLVEPEEGGETAFPNSGAWIHPEMGEPTQGPFSACAKGHVAFKPKRGDALLFWDVKPDYKKSDSNSMHTGCPVIKGTKWTSVFWIHGKPFRPEEYRRSLEEPYSPLPDPGVCTNLHDMCEKWAAEGECTKNPGYMTGSNNGQGNCRLACKSCTPCKEGDTQCIAENRKRGGYMNFEESELRLAELGVPPGTVVSGLTAAVKH